MGFLELLCIFLGRERERESFEFENNSEFLQKIRVCLLAPSLRLSFFLHPVFFTAVVPKKKSSCLLPSFHPHPSICLLLNQLLLLLLFASSLGIIPFMWVGCLLLLLLLLWAGENRVCSIGFMPECWSGSSRCHQSLTICTDGMLDWFVPFPLHHHYHGLFHY